jgi:ArsR family transcriptional regulator
MNVVLFLKRRIKLKIKREIKVASKLLKAIADPSRFSIIDLLVQKETYVGEIIKKIKIEPTLLSHHLSILKDAGIVTATRRGKQVLYKLAPNVKVPGRNRGVRLGASKYFF